MENSETENRAIRVLSDLDAAFRRHPDISEFDILPVKEPESNRSPIIVAELALGMELWSARLVYIYCYGKLMKWRSHASGCHLLHSTRSVDAARNILEPPELLRLSRAVILINPECYSIWNIRKELLQEKHVSVYEELKLSALVLSKHPKSPETFAHRKWILSLSCFGADIVDNSQIEPNQSGNPSLRVSHIIPRVMKLSTEELKALINEEMRVCTMAAEKYANNYNAWSHRIWVIINLFNCNKQFIMAEYENTRSYVSMHVSDHSGFHYRQFLLSNAEQTSSILQQELDFISELISVYPGHEALWYHRRFIIHAMYNLQNISKSDAVIDTSSSTEGEDLLIPYDYQTVNVMDHCLVPQSSKCAKKLKIDDSGILKSEITKIELIIDSEPDNSWQQQLAKAYMKWIKQYQSRT
ncbi:protein prenyltransferase alpha subunit repeat-containing protein 1-A [Lingula anatina]|uniref:Protein prenyltransferase alpha subunit repeat-containing protein 1-A n=1 Tax=Lingula anatina TaxID=7574 RepID=A0A1S3IB36_LINAN|nr:protein prenyltransferase alpha subunit repeat-containing protein 1-A [Lingula anatina]|eukprot:XP_013395480.1 protein prenyltransferase alpha subunit repeat-containing protein 1-A [Lingula anatina]